MTQVQTDMKTIREDLNLLIARIHGTDNTRILKNLIDITLFVGEKARAYELIKQHTKMMNNHTPTKTFQIHEINSLAKLFYEQARMEMN